MVHAVTVYGKLLRTSRTCILLYITTLYILVNYIVLVHRAFCNEDNEMTFKHESFYQFLTIWTANGRDMYSFFPVFSVFSLPTLIIFSSPGMGFTLSSIISCYE